MRKLLTALLVLPFLLGANGDTAVSVMGGHAAADGHTATAAAPQAMQASTLAAPQPPLPAHFSSAGPAAGTALLEGPDSPRWRIPLRSGSHGHDLLRARGNACCASERIGFFQYRELDFGHALSRLRIGQPASYGNPPPASLT